MVHLKEFRKTQGRWQGRLLMWWLVISIRRIRCHCKYLKTSIPASISKNWTDQKNQNIQKPKSSKGGQNGETTGNEPDRVFQKTKDQLKTQPTLLIQTNGDQRPIYILTERELDPPNAKLIKNDVKKQKELNLECLKVT